MERAGVAINTYAGPARTDGGPRIRWQITNELTGQWVTLSAEQWLNIVQWFDEGCPTLEDN